MDGVRNKRNVINYVRNARSIIAIHVSYFKFYKLISVNLIIISSSNKLFNRKLFKIINLRLHQLLVEYFSAIDAIKKEKLIK